MNEKLDTDKLKKIVDIDLKKLKKKKPQELTHTHSASKIFWYSPQEKFFPNLDLTIIEYNTFLKYSKHLSCIVNACIDHNLTILIRWLESFLLF